MKYLGNPALKKRLREASLRWKNAEPNRTLEKRKRSEPRAYHGGILIAPIPIFGMFLPDGGIAVLSVILPLMAYFFFKGMTGTRGQLSWMPTIYLLPISDAILDREMHRRWKIQLLIGSLLAAVYGYFLSGPVLTTIGSLKSLVIFWSFLALFGFTIYRKIGAFLIGMVCLLALLLFLFVFYESSLAHLLSFLDYLPWKHVFQDGVKGWGYLAVIACIGAGSYFGVWHFWKTVSPLDRTQFYENFGSGHFLDDDEEDELMDDHVYLSPIPMSGEPTGIVERLIWKFFNNKEKAITRLAGFCSQSFLKYLLRLGVIFLLAIGVRYLSWSEELNMWLNIGGLFVIGGFSIIFTNRLVVPSSSFISESCQASSLGLLPLNLRFLEKRFLKEGMTKYPLIAAVGALGIDLLLYQKIEIFFVLFCFLLIGQFLFNLSLLWHHATAEWSARKSKRRFMIHLSHLGILAICLTIAGTTFAAGFSSVDPTEYIVGLILIIVCVCTPLAILCRLTLGWFLGNPRHDLVS